MALRRRCRHWPRSHPVTDDPYRHNRRRTGLRRTGFLKHGQLYPCDHGRRHRRWRLAAATPSEEGDGGDDNERVSSPQSSSHYVRSLLPLFVPSCPTSPGPPALLPVSAPQRRTIQLCLSSPGSDEGYRDMEDFIGQVDNPDRADRLGLAIDGRTRMQPRSWCRSPGRRAQRGWATGQRGGDRRSQAGQLGPLPWPTARRASPETPPRRGGGEWHRPTPVQPVGEKPQAGAVVTVEVLVEHQVVLPGRVVLQPIDAPEAGPPAVPVDQEDRDQALAQVLGDLPSVSFWPDPVGYSIWNSSPKKRW